MKPYYQDKSCTLFHGDCAEIVPELVGDSKSPPHDLLFLDPPFNAYEKARFPRFSTTLAFTNWQNRDAVTSILGTPRCELVWHFSVGRWTSHKLPRQTHELILAYGQTGEAYVGEEQDTTPIKKSRGCVGKSFMGPRMYRPRPRKILGSVINCPRAVNGPLGAWGKPLPLIKTLLEWADRESVLDPFCGGGTTLLAARELGITAVGIELDEAHCEIAAKRMSQGVMELAK